MFSSVREAVAYAMSHRRGPQMSRVTLGASSRGGWRSHWDGSEVRACLVRAGVAPGSEEEMELESWSRGRGLKPTRIERAVARELAAAGLLARHQDIGSRSDLVHVTWTDRETGEPLQTLGHEREGKK